MIIIEQYQSQWFALPKELVTEYSERIGVTGIALYAYLAANCDESFECILPDSRLCDALFMTSFEVRETLQLLKDTRLVKHAPYGVNQTLYTLLWQPSQVF